MNGCKRVELNFDSVSYLSTKCDLADNKYNYATTSYYLNISSFHLDSISGNYAHAVICKYDKNYNMISRVNYNGTEDGIDVVLDENYYYRISWTF